MGPYGAVQYQAPPQQYATPASPYQYPGAAPYPGTHVQHPQYPMQYPPYVPPQQQYAYPYPYPQMPQYPMYVYPHIANPGMSGYPQPLPGQPQMQAPYAPPNSSGPATPGQQPIPSPYQYPTSLPLQPGHTQPPAQLPSPGQIPTPYGSPHASGQPNIPQAAHAPSQQPQQLQQPQQPQLPQLPGQPTSNTPVTPPTVVSSTEPPTSTPVLTPPASPPPASQAASSQADAYSASPVAPAEQPHPAPPVYTPAADATTKISTLLSNTSISAPETVYTAPNHPAYTGEEKEWDAERVKQVMTEFAESKGVVFKVGDYVGSPAPERRLDFNSVPMQVVMEEMDESIDQWRTNQPVTTVHSFTAIELPSLSRDDYPTRLIDLQTNTVVLTSTFTTLAEYTVLSHVWGTDLVMVDGQKYGVEWRVPIRSERKLSDMLDGVRAYGRTRYCWLDVLCVPQGQDGKNHEVQKMGYYYSNTSLCIVYIDDEEVIENPQALTFIKAVNAMFGNTSYGRKTKGKIQEMFQGGNAFELGMNTLQAYGLVMMGKVVEEASWFKRVWTFQEGVLPPFCTFLFGRKGAIHRNEWWMLLRTANVILKMGIERQIEFSGLMAAISGCMQESPMWHLQWFAELRKRREVGFWETVQAVQSRQCAIDVDRIYGILGIVPRNLHPEVDYSTTYDELYQSYWRRIVEAGDWRGSIFIGGHLPGTTTSCIPTPATSKGGLIVSPQPPPTVKDLTVATVHSDGVKFAEASVHDVEWIWSMIKLGNGEDLCGASQHVLYVEQAKAAAAARAMELDDEILDDVCVGMLAFFGALASLTQEGAFDAITAALPNAAPKIEAELGRGLLLIRQLTLLYKYAPHIHFAALGYKEASGDKPNAAVVAFEEKPQGPIRLLFGVKAGGSSTTREGLVLDMRDGKWHKIGVVCFAGEVGVRPGSVLVA
ncbi:hypothetical protein HK097_003328 [Rhizophlyctis rosea]|uniref:Heterokaryon incompatibility domain-containing protein n=1 Tax=Rhizophlyctis rosea TaxID=64517 RepID=A0AAD5SGN8_9FUNG|nr:hypothetical protein HK097_003328 [Rhizophlyctis rosea]